MEVPTGQESPHNGCRILIEIFAPMSDVKPEIQAVSVVLLGSFNPGIFHPAWFASEGLIQKSESESSEIAVITSDVAAFSVGWMALEVLHDRFTITTNQPQYFEALRDLAMGTFTLLRHTPVKHLGINKLDHYGSENREEWHHLGHRLAPPDQWSDLLEKPGMRRIQIEGVRPDNHKGRILVTIEPSSKVNPGVYFQVNDHYDVGAVEEGRSCEAAIRILRSEWQKSLDRAARITKCQMTK